VVTPRQSDQPPRSGHDQQANMGYLVASVTGPRRYPPVRVAGPHRYVGAYSVPAVAPGATTAPYSGKPSEPSLAVLWMPWQHCKGVVRDSLPRVWRAREQQRRKRLTRTSDERRWSSLARGYPGVGGCSPLDRVVVAQSPTAIKGRSEVCLMVQPLRILSPYLKGQVAVNRPLASRSRDGSLHLMRLCIACSACVIQAQFPGS
jgi:hypothetical protein